MTEGWKIYKDFGDNRMPGFYLIFYPFIYFYKLIYQPPYENIIYFVRIFAMLSSFVSMIFIFEIGRFIRNEMTGLIAAFLYIISPFALGFNDYVFLENFMLTFSMIGFYFFIRGVENDSKKSLFLSGVFFGFSISIKQMALLIFPIIIFMLLLRNMDITNSKWHKKFLKELVVIIYGMVPISLFLLIYLIYNGTLDNFIHLMMISVQEADKWMSPSKERILNDYIIPVIKSNELITITLGFIGILFGTLFSFIILLNKMMRKKNFTSFLSQNRSFGIYTLSIWPVFYILMMYMFSSSYAQYYIPMLPPFVIISSCMIDYFLTFVNKKHMKLFLIFIFIFVIIDINHISNQYRNYSQNPMKLNTLMTPPLDQQISIGKYLYNNTDTNDKIFSIDPIYALTAGRFLINHFTVGVTGLPTTREFVEAFKDEKIKYAVIDERARLHLSDKWAGKKIENINLSMDIKIKDAEDAPMDGIIVGLRHKENVSLWWIHANDWKLPENQSNKVHHNILIGQDNWSNINIDMTSEFKKYFGYTPETYKFTIWSNTNDGSHIEFQIDKIKLYNENKTYFYEDFDTDESLKRFSNLSTESRGWSTVNIKNSNLNVESFNEIYSISTTINSGLYGYILKNFEKEKDFVITARETEPRKTVVSLYRRIK